jgi:ribosome-associated protein
MPDKIDASIEAIARRCLEVCEERKAEDILLYDVRKTSLLADYYLICSASSEPQIRAIASHLQKAMVEEGVRPLHVDGVPASHWMILDFGAVLIHIFHEETRKFYLLEELWSKDQLVYPKPEA